MQSKKFVVRNVVQKFEWIGSNDLQFNNKKVRLKKALRKKVKDAIATLKGVGLISPKMVEQLVYQVVILDPMKIEQFLMERHREILDRFGTMECCIVMGQHEFFAPTNARINRPMSFPFADVQCDHLQHNLIGMNLVILPWMEGTILIPKSFMPIDRQLIPSGIMITAETHRKMQEKKDAEIAKKLWNDMGAAPDIFDE